MNTGKQTQNSFTILRDEVLNENEKEGLDRLFIMALTLRQQISLRNKFNSSENGKRI